MIEQDEWRQWSERWQHQPVVDVQRLQRQVRNKHWRMVAMVAFEAVTSLLALVQTAGLIHHPALSLRWKIFCIAAMVLVLVFWMASFWLRRGTWRARGDNARALMQLTEHRAHAGIRLAKAGLYGLALLLVVVVVLAWPQLQPARWQHDARLRQILLVQVAFNGPIVLATVAFNLWYIRRQRRRLSRIARFLADDG
jgi:hypothetical protein